MPAVNNEPRERVESVRQRGRATAMPCLGQTAQPVALLRVKRLRAEFGTRPRQGGAGNFARARVRGYPGTDVRDASGRCGIRRMRDGTGTCGGRRGWAKDRMAGARGRIVASSHEIDDGNGDSRGSVSGCDAPGGTRRSIIRAQAGISSRSAWIDATSRRSEWRVVVGTECSPQ